MLEPSPRPCSTILAALFLCLVFVTVGKGQDDDLELERPGLIASISSTQQPDRVVRRIESGLSGQWDQGAPDARISADQFKVTWSGLLLIQSPGVHRFHCRTDGAFELSIADKVVLRGEGTDVRLTDPVELRAGFTPITLVYRHKSGDAHVAMDWEGPTFGREPIPSHLLFHDSTQPVELDLFETGRRLADRLGCANCHKLIDLPTHPNHGPALADSGRSINPAWLDLWLRDPGSVRSGTRMPTFGAGFSVKEAADLRAFLTSLPSKASEISAEGKMALNVASPAKGRLLFRSLGCLGCHTRGEAPSPNPTAPDLSDLPHKRTVDSLTSFLGPTRVSKSGSKHRHDLKLKVDEAAHLAAYLASNEDQAKPSTAADQSPPKGDANRGRRLAESANCASCHSIPGLKAKPARQELSAGLSGEAGCLSEHPTGPFVPRFSLTGDQRKALRAFIQGLPKQASPTSRQTLANDSIRRLNCLGCHARDGGGGKELGERIAEHLASDPELGGLKGTLTPPNLTGVGDKLQPEYLGRSVRSTAPTARPWLSVRMPTFAFEPGEADAIVASLQNQDRMSAKPDPRNEVVQLKPAELDTAAQLIGQKGFGCINCHVLSGRIPPGGEPETLGPDLALAHLRMPERYFHRWIGNPQRIIAGTPMPQFIKPIETQSGSLDDQLNLIWRLLASGKLNEVASASSRVVLKHDGDRALIVRDMVLLPDAPDTKFIPRSLAIGLKNDQTLHFDADRLSWLSWWHKGFLARTKSGRLWEWHPEGERLWITSARRPPIVFLQPEGPPLLPEEVRERFGRLEEVTFEGQNVSFTYSLNGPRQTTVKVAEHIQPTDSGWERSVTVSGVPEGLRPALLEQPPGGQWTWTVGTSTVALRFLDEDRNAPATSSLPGESDTRVLPLPPTGPGEFKGRVRLEVKPR